MTFRPASVLGLALAACSGGADPTPPDTNVPPEARLTATPSLTSVGEVVALSAGGSLDTDGTIVSYRFVFADGSPAVIATGPEITHLFAAAGRYEVALTVTDDAGATASATTIVNVTDAPPP